MAYDIAIEASVDPTLINIYLTSVILSDSTWYSETSDPAVRLSGSEQLEMQLDACTRGVARLEEWLVKLEVESYVLAPIVSEEKWDTYEQTLEGFGEPQDPGIEPSGGAYVEDLHVHRPNLSTGVSSPTRTASTKHLLERFDGCF